MESRKRPRRGTAPGGVAAATGAAVSFRLTNIDELIESGGQISLGAIYPLRHVIAVANDEHNSLAMLQRKRGETLQQLLERLDAAIGLAWTAGRFTDEINAASPRGTRG
jgi:hypothetical protein